MNPKFLVLIASAVVATTANSQKQTFVAKDGTKIDVKIVSTNPDEGRRASVYTGMFGPEGVNFIGASYYKPTSFYLSALGGPQGGMVDGSFFMFSKLKDSKLKQSVKSSYYFGIVTRYVVSVPVEKRKSIGFHGGTSYVNYSSTMATRQNFYSTNSVFGGVTFLSAKHTHWEIDGDYKEAQGTTVGRLNADVIYYINRQLILPEDETGHYSIDDLSRKIGFRVYFDGKTSIWSRHGRIAIHYMLGVGKNSDKTLKLPMFAGLGLGYNFL